MDNEKPSAGRSSSMPNLNQRPSEAQKIWEQTYRAGQTALQHSPDFQEYRNRMANIWAPNGVEFTSPTMPTVPAPGDDSNFGSPSSDTTVKNAAHFDLREGSSPPDFTPGSPDSDATVVPEKDEEDCEDIFAFSPHRSSTDSTALAFSTQAQGSMGVYYPLSTSNHGTPIQEPESHSRSSSGAGSTATFMTDYSNSMSEASEDSNGCMSSPHRHPNQMPRTPTKANKACSPEDLHVPDENLYHRRASNRMSSLPPIPSPLGLGHASKADRSSDSSGLLSPFNNIWGPPGAQNNNHGLSGLAVRKRENAAGADVGNLMSFTPTDTTFSHKAFGHSRQETDPFVDNTNQFKIPAFSPHVGQFPKSLSYSSQAPNTAPIQPSAPAASPGFANVLSLLQQGHPNLPIPPPALPTVEGKLTFTPESRARLDAQKTIREEWIKTEAKKIVELQRNLLATQQKYQYMGSSADKTAMAAAAQAFAEATSTEKRQEERRNLFMPQGIQAMRSGPAPGEGPLLVGQMAYLERVCAEVKRREGEDEEITPEMLSTLTRDEKKELRAHLVGRLAKRAA